MINSNVIGIDLAKHVIQVCKIDKHGELISNKAIKKWTPLVGQQVAEVKELFSV